MNTIQHLMTVLGEEGAEIAQDASKCNRFGCNDRNFLNPTGPTNTERLVNELNDLIGVVEMLIAHGVLPEDWMSRQKIEAKKEKVFNCMEYARKVGALEPLK
jgi:hypothetical protein